MPRGAAVIRYAGKRGTYTAEQRVRDAENPTPTLNACCDGLVDAGIVKDDSPQFMTKDMPVIHPAGPVASAIFALGFIASGVLAVPVLAGSGASGLAGLFKEEWGYSRSPKSAPVFYGLVALGTLGGTAFTLLGSNVIQLLVVVGLVNGLAATPFLVVLMRVSSDPEIMGEHRHQLRPRVIPLSCGRGWPEAGRGSVSTHNRRPRTPAARP